MSRRNLFNPRGYTLIEMIIAVTLVSIITLALVTFTTQIMRGYKYMELQSNTAVDSSNNLNRMARVIRGATDIIEAQPSSITLYAYFSPNDAVVKKVRYYSSGSSLMVSVIPPSGTAPNYTYNQADAQILTLRNNVTNASSLFRYFDGSGSLLSGGFGVSQIKQVGLTIGINPESQLFRQDLRNETIVTLRNKKTNL